MVLSGFDANARRADTNKCFLLVQTNGSKLWRLSYRFGGKHKALAIGAYPAVDLYDALQRDEAKRLLSQETDRVAERKREKLTQKLSAKHEHERTR